MAAAPTLPSAGFEVERYHMQLRPDLSTTALAGAQRSRLRSTSDHLTPRYHAATPVKQHLSSAPAEAPTSGTSRSHNSAYAFGP